MDSMVAEVPLHSIRNAFKQTGWLSVASSLRDRLGRVFIWSISGDSAGSHLPGWPVRTQIQAVELDDLYRLNSFSRHFR